MKIENVVTEATNDPDGISPHNAWSISQRQENSKPGPADCGGIHAGDQRGRRRFGGQAYSVTSRGTRRPITYPGVEHPPPLLSFFVPPFTLNVSSEPFDPAVRKTGVRRWAHRLRSTGNPGPAGFTDQACLFSINAEVRAAPFERFNCLPQAA